MIEPTPYVGTLPDPPTGSSVKRGLVALFVEHRLPYRVSIALDRVANAIGVRQKTVTADGFTLRVRRLTCDERFVHNIILNRDYTPPGFEIHDHDTVIDIGGNIGTFALHAARAASRGRVFCFEPNAENYALLLKNLRRNRINNVVAVQAAVGAARSRIKLFTAPQGGFHSLLADRANDEQRFELVDCLGLKDIFDEHCIERCDLLKLDCEGAEYDILYNLPADYFRRIGKIVMEYHGDTDKDRRHAKANALVAHLVSVGFRIDAYLDFTGFDCGMIRATRSDAHRPA